MLTRRGKSHQKTAAYMTKNELSALFRASLIYSRWHWFSYHFKMELEGPGHPLAAGILRSALECEARMPGYAEELVKRISSICGLEKHLLDWEQLLTILAELHVVAQICRWGWPEGTTFEKEPIASGSKRNPEIAVRVGNRTYGYEVKAPALFSHGEARGTNPIQVASRFLDKDTLTRMVGDQGGVTWPRDNPVKDFLISAEKKFEPFVRADENFTGILVICWDDFIYEPISALDQSSSGLLTPNSFYRTKSGEAVTFPSVSGIVVLRPLTQFVRACQDKPLGDGLSGPFDYGPQNAFPWKTFHKNPASKDVPQDAIECLHAIPPTLMMGAEYRPQEQVMWF